MPNTSNTFKKQISYKSEELANYFLRKYPDHFITGSPDCSSIIYRYNSHILLLIAIGVEYNPYELKEEDASKYILAKKNIDIRVQEHLRLASSLVKQEIVQCRVLLYPTLMEYEENNWREMDQTLNFSDILFFICDSDANGTVVNGAELRNIIHNAILYDKPEIGTGKAENKQVSCFLQRWTRIFLGTYIKIVDIDGMFHDGNYNPRVLLEIKRSNDPQWLPYLEDYSNYKVGNELAHLCKIIFFVVKHNKYDDFILLSDNEKVQFYNVTGILEDVYKDLDAKNEKKGRFLNVVRSGQYIGSLKELCAEINKFLGLSS